MAHVVSTSAVHGNTTERPIDVVFDMQGAWSDTVDVAFESRDLPLRQGMFCDHYAALEVHVHEWDKTAKPASLDLQVVPGTVAGPVRLAVRTHGGQPGNPALVAVMDVNGQSVGPISAWLGALNSFGVGGISMRVPAGLGNATVGFQAFSPTAAGTEIVSSPRTPLVFR